MKLVIADITDKDLDNLKAELSNTTDVISVCTDVAKSSDVIELGKRTKNAFGVPHFVFNNAGVAASGLAWEHTVEDWNWIMGVSSIFIIVLK